MLGAINIAGAQVVHQQLLTAEDVQRQEAVMVVVAMEEASLLHAVHPVIGGVEIQDQLARHFPERGNELLQHHFVYGEQRFPVGAVLQAAEGGLTGQRREAVHRRLDRRVMTQCLVVIEIFIAQAKAVDPLLQQAQLGMDHLAGIPPILEHPVDRRQQAETPVHLAQQQHTAVGGDVTAGELGLYLAAF